MKSKKEMIRVIRTSDGEFLLDATGRKNGAVLISVRMAAALQKQ